MVNIFLSCLKWMLIHLFIFRNMLRLLYKYSYFINKSVYFSLPVLGNSGTGTHALYVSRTKEGQIIVTLFKWFKLFNYIRWNRSNIIFYTKDWIYILILFYYFKMENSYFIYKNLQLCKLINRQGNLSNLNTYKIENEITLFREFIDININEAINTNKKFLDWFIGFTEGDGSFVVSKGKVYFDLTQTIDDIQVLVFIQKELGFGQILKRTEEHRRVGVFYVTGKENFCKLIDIFNGNLCSLYKKEQFKNWLTAFNKQYSENKEIKDNNIKPSLETGWLSGFIDAEGHLGGRVKYCRTSKLKKAPHLSLTISQKEEFILSGIRELFIKNNKCISYDKSWNGWRLHISSFKTLIIVIGYLNNFELKTKKKFAFNRFVECHKLIIAKKHLTIEGISELEKLINYINK